MFKNLNLSSKLNLLLLLIFIIIISITGFFLSFILNRNAEQVITDKAFLLIDTMSAVRNYTSNQINPELAPRLETEEYFLPQTVPAYSAREVFEYLRNSQEYQDFFYKEATLNPTNLRDKADKFETQIVENFRQNQALTQQTGFRSLPGGNIYYIARPLAISQESCLRCHGDPKIAPKSQLATYGSENGYGWQLNEIVGAQVISVPATTVFQSARRLKIWGIFILSICLLATILLINFFFKKTVTKPLKNMSQWATQVSTAPQPEIMPEEYQHKNNDEIGILAASLNRMKRSLEIAMNMINSELK